MLDSVSSPYARIGPALVSNGYSAIPIMPGSKRPGTMSRGRWYGDLDWTRFSDRLPTDIEVGVWKRYPDAGICVVLGGEHNVVAIDVDTEDGDEVEALRKIIPELPVAKRGAKGYTAFFRAAPQIASRPFDTKHGRAVDLLCRGKQTVVAPTLHPETGLPYMWLTDSTLEHISPERLPMLPDDIAERIAEALAPFGYVPGAIRERGERTSFGGDVWDDVKAEALLRLDQWVPHLGIDAHRKRNGNWRGVAVWRGGKNCNVGFDPTGIVDFKTGEGITAIDVVMRALDMEDHEALDWLKSKLGFEDAPESEVEFLLKPRSAPDDGATDEEKQAAWEEAARLNFERLPAEQRRAHEDLTRIYVRARLANGGEHPRYTEEVAAELGPQYREAFLKIDLGMFYVEPPLGVPEPVVEAPPGPSWLRAATRSMASRWATESTGRSPAAFSARCRGGSWRLRAVRIGRLRSRRLSRCYRPFAAVICTDQQGRPLTSISFASRRPRSARTAHSRPSMNYWTRADTAGFTKPPKSSR